jgi:hypothetical protein
LKKSSRGSTSDPRNADGTHMAICPAHDDNGPSLSIKKGDDGRTLLHCFHGCDAKRIMESIGKELADLFPRRVVRLRAIEVWTGRKEAQGQHHGPQQGEGVRH